jgi:hypothetical protein
MRIDTKAGSHESLPLRWWSTAYANGRKIWSSSPLSSSCSRRTSVASSAGSYGASNESVFTPSNSV